MMPKALLITLLLALLLPGGAHAQRMEGDRAGASGMYQAEVAVGSQAESARQSGFARALAQVLGKMSGDAGVANRPGVSRELRRAGDFVEGYDYRQDEGRSAAGSPTYTTMLVVRFREDEVNAIAGALGLPVWPEPRPKPVLWLAIDDGSGPRLVAVGQSNVARPVLDRATERGYRLGLPGGSAAEQAAVGAIWRGDTAAISRLSARYRPPMQLIGKLYRAGPGWKADWSFVDDGRVLATWSNEDAVARRVIASGADGAADALVRRYAKASTVGEPAVEHVVVTGINSSNDFVRLSSWLQSSSVVRGIRPLRATPNSLELELDLLTGLEGFRRVLDDSILVESGANIEGVTPEFHLR
ncbi:hypothetical protein GCM10011394_21480 [Luteimonas terricola]|uniref:DUF2066 domain-containing protein n=2 Tax=Luteimonas terricola TaxID=645597 RepID=A0ABQ2EGR6_9GAMM|nr:hypothetical protein GCM10011394_21480 [Luteimonas terricola]